MLINWISNHNPLFNRPFDKFFDDFVSTQESVKRIPSEIDVVTDKDALLLYADVPGVKQENIGINLDGRQLVLTATRYRHLSTGKVEDHYKEAFVLRADLDTDAISARLTDGVLTIRIPKKEAARPKQIPIQTS